jgi:hypothetical protein
VILLAQTHDEDAPTGQTGGRQARLTGRVRPRLARRLDAMRMSAVKK